MLHQLKQPAIEPLGIVTRVDVGRKAGWAGG
jgi:hypothetical protein